ncbi:hypothetical protein GIB67_015887 [Kingdonia uniflora]|uniref:F-box associated beta-propeller type 1 domain-containing protein n=1 Tax=Kingdonia uniflora TaxID=39325 RepID=A0A7J7NGH2_9MAGN|nr:hypothetical protein GIB67_015887 [Kingdonia uniflora]
MANNLRRSESLPLNEEIIIRCLETSSPNYVYRDYKHRLAYFLIDDHVGVPRLPLKCSQTSYHDFVVSSNGLLCYVGYVSPTKVFYVFNPVTTSCHEVLNPKKRYHVGFAFDPLVCTLHYELVHSYAIKEFRKYRFEVYSSKTKSWSVSKAKVKIIDHGIDIVSEISVFVNGKLYWRLPIDIMWYDLEKHTAGFIRGPVHDAREHSNVEIGKCGGSLVIQGSHDLRSKYGY